MNIPITKPFFDSAELQAVKEALESGWVAQGPKTHSFEIKFARFTNTYAAIATTSCTTALHLALVAEGIGAGQDVIVPSFTFIATANAVEYTHATPVFCDIDINTFNIDSTRIKEIILSLYTENAGKLINSKTGNQLTAILPVHLFGLAADMSTINDLAQEFGLKVIEDAACGLGAMINGVHAGAFGNLACFSLHPRKAITCGEGGVVTVNNGDKKDQLIALRNHGATVSDLQRHNGGGWLLPDYKMLGYNYRLTDIQGAVIDVQMDKVQFILGQRKILAKYYDDKLKDIRWLTKPLVPEGYSHGYQSYVCKIDYQALGLDCIEEGYDWRNKLMEKLEKAGIATRQGTHAVHLLKYYKQKYNLQNGMYPASYMADRLTIALPLYVGMTNKEQDFVMKTMISLANTN